MVNGQSIQCVAPEKGDKTVFVKSRQDGGGDGTANKRGVYWCHSVLETAYIRTKIFRYNLQGANITGMTIIDIRFIWHVNY